MSTHRTIAAEPGRPGYVWTLCDQVVQQGLSTRRESDVDCTGCRRVMVGLVPWPDQDVRPEYCGHCHDLRSPESRDSDTRVITDPIEAEDPDAGGTVGS
jgi:hypothetical protein